MRRARAIVGFPYLALILAAGGARVAELALSRRNERRTSGSQAAASTYPLMVGLHVALFAAPLLEVALRRPPRPRAAGAWTAAVVGATLVRWWCIASLGPAWNARALVPADLRPVARGPYRWLRHPNYVAVAVEFLALPLAGGAWVSGLTLSALNVFALWPRIREEERLLAAVPGYSDAFAGRPRFVPGLF